MSFVLSFPEEMSGKTIATVGTGSRVINMTFTDGSCYSIKLERDINWTAKDHLEKTKKYATTFNEFS